LTESAQLPINPDPRMQSQMREFLMTANYSLKKGKMPSLDKIPSSLKMIIEKFPPDRILSFVKSDRRELDKIAKAAGKLTTNKYFQYAIAVGAILKSRIDNVNPKSSLKDIIDLIKKHKSNIIEVAIAGVLIGLLWWWVSTSWLPGFMFGVILFILVCWGIKTVAPPGSENDDELSSGSSSRGGKSGSGGGGSDSIL
jgi:hypothetical protein